MKRKIIYLANNTMEDDFGEIAFENKLDAIDFCKKKESEGNCGWGWHEITFYYS